MSSTEARKSSLADHVVSALSPALVMGLVGSLAFFLVEVFYGGAYGPELRYLLFCWVFGAVLCARISLMGEIAGRAHFYGGVLGVLVWVGTMLYVSYPKGSPAEPLCGLINCVLVGIIYGSAWKVTRDCTDVDGNEKVNDDGLLQAAGLEALDPRPVEPEPEPESPRDMQQAKPAPRKKTPGVWIVYFSLAALPLFGLGQAFLPLQEEDTRERAFWMLVVYTGCGLGLLLTTCFLRFRHYLRQRKLRMPGSMTATWLTVGGGLIATLLLVAGMLPRPWAETGPFRYRPAISEEHDASEYAQRGQSARKGEGRDNSGDGRSESGDKEGDEIAKSGKQGNGQDKGKSGGDKEGKATDSENKSGGGQHGEGRGHNQGNRGRQNPSPQASDQRSSGSTGTSALGELANQVGGVLKWIVFGLLALAVLVFILRGGLRYLATFSQWARDLLNALRNLWARLFGGAGASKTNGSDSVWEAVENRVKPFADYPDPFADGSAQRMKATVLIRYAFEALQAWAAERNLARQPDETPAEFARRLGDEIPAIDGAARQLATLYVRAAYAPGSVPAAAIEPLTSLWQRLEGAGTAPMSVFGEN